MKKRYINQTGTSISVVCAKCRKFHKILFSIIENGKEIWLCRECRIKRDKEKSNANK